MDADEIRQRMVVLQAELDDCAAALAELDAAAGGVSASFRRDLVDAALEGSIYGYTARELARAIDAPFVLVLERLLSLRDSGQAHYVATRAGARWRWIFESDQHELSAGSADRM